MDLIGGGTPKTSTPEYWGGSIPWLSVKDFNNDKRYVYTTEKTITEDGLANSSTKLLNHNDSIISARGTVGEIAMIPFPMAFNQSCYGLRAKKEIVTPVYLYYLIKHNIHVLRKNTHGSVFDTITRDTFAGIDVDIPEIKIQNSISAILSSIDDKIELNTTINENLFEQLLALYKQMLIDSKIVKKLNLAELCDFQEGYVNPAQTHPEYFDGEVKWLRAVDINESFIINTSRTLTKTGFESAKKSALLFDPNTIVISKSGTIGRLGIIADYMCGNRAVINIRPKSKEHLPLIYCYLKSRQSEFDDLAVGSVQKNLYISLLEPLIIPCPSDNEVVVFCSTANVMLSRIKNNCIENNNLIALRDTLLPRLMNGELDVSQVQI